MGQTTNKPTVWGGNNNEEAWHCKESGVDTDASSKIEKRSCQTNDDLTECSMNGTTASENSGLIRTYLSGSPPKQASPVCALKAG